MHTRTTPLTRVLPILAAGLLAFPASAGADVKLPSVVGSNMVLQRDEPVHLRGWADPGEEVTVQIGDQEKTVETDDEGAWRVTLDAMQAGGPLTMTIEGDNRLTLKNILVGEVWVCSGQSNMEWPVRRAKTAEETIRTADHPEIRLFDVPRTPATEPQNDVEAEWQVCSPKTVPSFTAVGYFFGRKLHKELEVPIGLISSNWGGTRIEPWTPPAGFDAVAELKSLAEQSRKQASKANRGKPTHLYNGMIHPLLPYTVRGAIWYQGEANRRDGLAYHPKMKALIRGWRSVWDDEDFPFYYVQLAPYRYGGADPQMLPLIWEAQLKTLSVPHTGMAVTVDIGNVKDIHPRNKLDVGRRLARWALAKDYGYDDLVYSGPLYKSMSVEHGKARISFKHTGGGLATRDGEAPDWFTIAGSDRDFVEAEAKIDGDTVVVWSDKVDDPAAVRFGWHQEAEPNLINKEGLPASPFRTDGWEE